MEIIKRLKSRSKEYPPVLLYLDDLSALIGAANAVEIQNSDYRFSSLEDLKEHFGTTEIRNLSLSFSDPGASLEFGKFGVSLFVSSSATSGQTFHEIDEVLARCTRRPEFIYSFWFGLLGSIPGLTPFVVKYENYWVGAVLNGFVIVWIAAVIWASYIRFRRYATIYLERRHERRTFWKRNSDQIAMQIITLVLGAVLGFAGAQIKDRYLPPSISSGSPNK